MFSSATKKILVGTAFVFVGVTGYMGFAKSEPPVMFTKLGKVISIYQNDSRLAVGTTSASVAKLGVYYHATDTASTVFEAASSTTSGGGLASLLKVTRNGCIQLTATSSPSAATPIKLVLSGLGATSTFNGTAYWQFGTCP